MESWVNTRVLSGGRSKRPLRAALSHSFLPWVGSVRALWKNMRMNSLNSSPERLTMLKTNFVVSEQIYVTMPCTYRMMSYEPLERPRLTGFMDHPQEGKRVAMPFILCFYWNELKKYETTSMNCVVFSCPQLALTLSLKIGDSRQERKGKGRKSFGDGLAWR